MSNLRAQGTITGWKDAQGFGFIVPDAGGDKLFVHHSAFTNRKRRPVDGAIVTYEIATNPKKRRQQASNVVFSMDARATAARTRPTAGFGGWLPPLFITTLAAMTFKGHLPLVILALYLVASMISFGAYAIDKSAAQSGGWRTRESTLHLIDLAGGWPGGLLAQKHVRHKSSKTSFQMAFWMTVIVNCAGLAWLLSPGGRAFLLQVLS